MSQEKPYIASIKYRNYIDDYCKDLKENTGLDYFVAYVLFNNGKKFVLSNMYHMLNSYYYEGYYQKDFSISENIISNRNYYLCNNDVCSVSPEFASILEEKFGVYRTFYTIKQSQECIFVFGGGTSKKIDDLSNLYQRSKANFDMFSFSFLQKATKIIKDHNPEYKNSIALNDDIYLKRLISLQIKAEATLSQREIECLFWAANGKTSEETAKILGLSTETINKYRSSLIHKLNCTNLCNAIYKAITYGFIGNFNNCFNHLKNENTPIIDSPCLEQYNNLITSPH